MLDSTDEIYAKLEFNEFRLSETMIEKYHDIICNYLETHISEHKDDNPEDLRECFATCALHLMKEFSVGDPNIRFALHNAYASLMWATYIMYCKSSDTRRPAGDRLAISNVLHGIPFVVNYIIKNSAGLAEKRMRRELNELTTNGDS